MGTTSTKVGRMGLLHPDFAFDAGLTLHSTLRTLYTTLADHGVARYFKQLDLADSSSVDFEHGFKAPFAQLTYYLYSIDGSGELTRIYDLSDYVIAASPNNPPTTTPTTHIRLTNNSGLEQDLVLIVINIPLTLKEITDVDRNLSPEDGQALVYQASSSSWVAGASGDASFKIQSVTDPDAVIKGGYILLQDGRELATYDGAGSLSTDFGKDITIDLDTILGASPVNATSYYLYIDTDALGAAVTCTDNGRVLIPVVESSFKLFTDTSDEKNLNRYIPIGVIRSADSGTVWSGTGAAIATLATLKHNPLGSHFSYVEKKIDTATTAATKSVTHNLSSAPHVIELEFYDASEDTFSKLSPQSFVLDNNNTTTEFDFSTVTFDTSDYIKIVLLYVPSVSNGFVSNATRYESPWFDSTATTSVAHGLDGKDSIKSLSLLEWDVTADRVKTIDPLSLVQDWNNTTIYFDWTGLIPSSTLKYKLVTGGNALPQAIASLSGSTFEFTATGVLTTSTTSFVCSKMFSDIPYAIEAVQKTASGWEPVDVFGLVYVTADGNKYLRGDIDSLVPSVSNPVRISVR
jgi:hypothetical protein